MRQVSFQGTLKALQIGKAFASIDHAVEVSHLE